MRQHEGIRSGGAILRLMAALCGLALCFVFGVPARAQPFASKGLPDVQLVIAPTPAGFQVAAVFPKVEPRTAIQKRLDRLASASGWKLSKLKFEDRKLDRRAIDTSDPRIAASVKNIEAVPTMSSVTFFTDRPLADFGAGTLELEPFVRAFRDAKRMHVTYIMMPQSFAFRGLSHYDDARVNIELSAQPGAFTYVVALKNHDFDVLNLPRVDVVKPTAVRAAQTPAPRLWLSTSFVLLLALLAAGGAFGLSQYIMSRR